jgi:adapter protein MecA 1/2
MKIEKVNENEIKVTISLDDLEERNIDLSALNYNSPATKELFWDMMEKAEIEYGFNTSNSQLCVEAVPDSTEGFILTITKLNEDGDFESIQKYITTKLKKNDLRIKRKNRRIYSAIILYSFSDFEDLCALSKKVHLIYSGDSSVYMHKNTYYLLLTRNNLTVTNPKMFEVLLSEYGKKLTNTGFYEGFLNEYATALIENNAIEVLNTYF